MPITNTSKPTSSMANTARVSFAETWASIPTTWATETRTWMGTSSLIGNSARPSGSITNVNRP